MDLIEGFTFTFFGARCDLSFLLTGLFENVSLTRIQTWRVKFDEVMADKEEDFGIRLKDVIHVVIIPQYKEELDMMKETLGVLASHAMAKTNYMVSM